MAARAGMFVAALCALCRLHILHAIGAVYGKSCIDFKRSGV